MVLLIRADIKHWRDSDCQVNVFRKFSQEADSQVSNGFPAGRNEDSLRASGCPRLICCPVVMLRNRLTILVPGSVLALVVVLGCGRVKTAPPGTPEAAAQARAEAQAAARKVDMARMELEQIPPPAKSHYMIIHTKESWSNPFLIVGAKNVTLRAMSPDLTSSPALPSALLKPARARQQELEIRLSDLPDALGALPPADWPYGRVIAVEEDPSETRADRIAVRRNVETTMQLLGNLGVVIYEWPVSGSDR